MTQQRRDSSSTQFGIWLRQQPEIDSALGFVATNLDYVWKNWKQGWWMLIEEKRFGYEPRFYQRQIFETLDRAARSDPNYRGFFTVVFENTNPDDGNILINGVKVTRDQLIGFLTTGRIPHRQARVA